MTAIQLLFAFDGRINRGRCFLALFIQIAVVTSIALLLLGVMGLVGDGTHHRLNFYSEDMFGVLDPAAWRAAWESIANSSGVALIPLLFRAVASSVTGWSYLAVSAKRLHDRDRSGWWTVPFIVFPGLISQFDDRLGDSNASSLIELLASILFLWGVIETWVLKGTNGPNRYGPDPLETVDPGTRWDQQSELESVPHSAGPSPGSHGKREHD